MKEEDFKRLIRSHAIIPSGIGKIVRQDGLGDGVSGPSRSANEARSSVSFGFCLEVSARASAEPRWGSDSVYANPHPQAGLPEYAKSSVGCRDRF